MALNKQIFPITFSDTVDTSDDPKLVIPSKFTKLEDVELDKVNTFRQRPGYTKQTLTSSTTYVATSPVDVANIKALHELGSEIVIEAGSGMHLFLRNRTVSLDGPAATAGVKSNERAQVDYWQTGISSPGGNNPVDGSFDVAVADPSGLECWVWVQGQVSGAPNVYFKVLDRFSGSTILQGMVSQGAGGASYDQPRVVVSNIAGASTFYIYYRESNAGVRIRVRSIAIAAGASVPSPISSISTVVTLGAASNPFDVCYCAAANKFFLAYRDSATTFVAISVLASDGITVSSTTTDPGAHANPRAIAVTATVASGVNYALAAYHLGTAFLYSFSVNTAGTAIAHTTLDTPAPDTKCRLAVMPNPWTDGSALVFYDTNPFAGLDPFQYDINFLRCTHSGASPTAVSPFARGVSLAARPAVYDALGNGVLDICVAGFLRSTIQSTVYLFKFGGSPAAASGFDALATHVPPRLLGRLFPGGCGSYNSFNALTTLPAPMAVV